MKIFFNERTGGRDGLCLILVFVIFNFNFFFTLFIILLYSTGWTDGPTTGNLYSQSICYDNGWFSIFTLKSNGLRAILDFNRCFFLYIVRTVQNSIDFFVGFYLQTQNGHPFSHLFDLHWPSTVRNFSISLLWNCFRR